MPRKSVAFLPPLGFQKNKNMLIADEITVEKEIDNTNMTIFATDNQSFSNMKPSGFETPLQKRDLETISPRDRLTGRS